MRTTLTIDDDVAVAVDRIRRARDASFKDIVNEALRRGLREMSGRAKPRSGFRTSSVDLGRLKSGAIDNVAEVLAIGEGDGFA